MRNHVVAAVAAVAALAVLCADASTAEHGRTQSPRQSHTPTSTSTSTSTSTTRLQLRVDPDTAVLRDGVAGFAPAFGFTAYGSVQLMIDHPAILDHSRPTSIGVMAWLPSLLPPAHVTPQPNITSAAQLATWLESPLVEQLFNASTVSQLFTAGVLQRRGIEPYVYLDNYCLPGAPHSICPHGGSPNSTDYDWFAVLLARYAGLVDAALRRGGSARGLRYVHVFNEPNAHYYVTHKGVGDYVAQFQPAAAAIQRAVPGIAVGGPVLYCAPEGTYHQHWSTWDTWSKPFIDGVLAGGGNSSTLGVFFDFHAYNGSARPAAVEGSVLAVDAYARGQYGVPLPSAVTETDYCLASAAMWNSPADELVHRAQPMLLAAMRLMRHPGRLLARQTFDLLANGSHCWYDATGHEAAGRSDPYAFSAVENMYNLTAGFLAPAASANAAPTQRLLLTQTLQQQPQHVSSPQSQSSPHAQPLALAARVGAEIRLLVCNPSTSANLSIDVAAMEGSLLFEGHHRLAASTPLAASAPPTPLGGMLLSAQGLEKLPAAALPAWNGDVPTFVLPAAGAALLRYRLAASAPAQAQRQLNEETVVGQLLTSQPSPAVMLNMTCGGAPTRLAFRPPAGAADLTLRFGIKANTTSQTPDAFGNRPPFYNVTVLVSCRPGSGAGAGTWEALPPVTSAADTEEVALPQSCMPSPRLRSAPTPSVEVSLSFVCGPLASPKLAFALLDARVPMPARRPPATRPTTTTAAAASSSDQPADSDGVVTLPGLGKLQGEVSQFGTAFRNIPFAEPPLGPLRWRPPTMYSTPWNGTRDARSFGPACMQSGSHGRGLHRSDHLRSQARSMWPWVPAQTHSAEAKAVPESEDCLFLNVFLPPNTTSASRLPVLFWIHGGAYETGSAVLYDGSGLAPVAGAVVVTVNYRLSVFGFLGADVLRSRDAERNTTGNYGLQDQRLGMAWVRKYIAVFGGDAEQVTIFGESAGAGSVSAHLASRPSWGLFARAVMESGSFAAWSAQPMWSAEWVYGQVLALTGCDSVACLEGKTADELVRVRATLNFLNPHTPLLIPWCPVVDGVELANHPMLLLLEGGGGGQPGVAPGVAVMHGTNRDEGAMFTSPTLNTPQAVLANWTRVFNSSVAAAAGRLYFGQHYPAHPTAPAAYWAAQRSEGDYTFSCPARQASRVLAAQGDRAVWEYFFDYTPGHAQFVVHSAELQYVWQTAGAAGGNAALARWMGLAWGAFGHGRAPAPATVWPPFVPAQQQLVHIWDANNITVLDNNKADECALWLPVVRERLEGYFARGRGFESPDGI